MTEEPAEYNVEQWGIVELMGHKIVAGKISKSEMMGKPMLRVDIPSVGDSPAFTQLYGEAAIYCITFTNKETATQVAGTARVQPVLVYETRQLPSPVDSRDDDEF